MGVNRKALQGPEDFQQYCEAFSRRPAAICPLVLFFLVTPSLAVSPARAQDLAGQSLKIAAFAETERSAIAEEQQSREDELYARGTKALDERQWDTAVAVFDQ